MTGDTGTARLLLQHPADIYLYCDAVCTPLTCALRRGHTDVVHLLEQYLELRDNKSSSQVKSMYFSKPSWGHKEKRKQNKNQQNHALKKVLTVVQNGRCAAIILCRKHFQLFY